MLLLDKGTSSIEAIVLPGPVPCAPDPGEESRGGWEEGREGGVGKGRLGGAREEDREGEGTREEEGEEGEEGRRRRGWRWGA
eukprot:2189760-Rhodomonas_salina.6